MPPLRSDAPISVAATLAVYDCVTTYVDHGVEIKWPNDVLAGGRKIAGVLVESRVTTDGNGFLVVGIGLNVNLDPPRFQSIADTATSLTVSRGSSVDMDEVEGTLLRTLDQRIAALGSSVDEVLTAWRSRLTTLGKNIAVHTREGVVWGVAEDVDGSGRLLLRDARGRMHTLAEGDVSLQA
jgi:BirA family biotin operon repressor/biotin-[acetyl-CoA-carboxylase] ligase